MTFHPVIILALSAKQPLPGLKWRYLSWQELMEWPYSLSTSGKLLHGFTVKYWRCENRHVALLHFYHLYYISETNTKLWHRRSDKWSLLKNYEAYRKKLLIQCYISYIEFLTYSQTSSYNHSAVYGTHTLWGPCSIIHQLTHYIYIFHVSVCAAINIHVDIVFYDKSTWNSLILKLRYKFCPENNVVRTCK